MEIEVTAEAVQYIAERGGQVYLWQEKVGGAWFLDRVAFNDPGPSVNFSNMDVSGLALLIASELDLPEVLKLAVRRFPRGLRIEWDGRPWGARGTVDGGG